jgi:predicted ATP-grasp superfamily ATP-dependent carboligase
MRPSENDNSVILIGASVRSLAASALRAGYAPRCIDLFGDSDLTWMLRQAGAEPPIRISSFAEAPAVLSKLPPQLPVVWAGGLENTPSVLRTISGQRHVLGPSADTVEHISHPQQLQSLVEHTTCRTPDVLWTNKRDITGNWLIKPVHSAGGIGIRRFQQGDTLRQGEFLQKHIDGFPVSALYSNGTNGTELLATSIQLTGTPELGGKGMTFCGNVGPASPPHRACQAIQEVGEQVALSGMLGVFGADFIVSTDNVWLVEINPRITASHEIHDLTLDGPSVLERHIAGCLRRPPTANSAGNELRGTEYLARLIIYSARDIEMTASDVQQLACYHQAADTWASSPGTREIIHSWISDIPAPGLVSAGDPFCSVYHVLRRDREGNYNGSANPRSIAIDSLITSYTGLSGAREGLTSCQS